MAEGDLGTIKMEVKSDKQAKLLADIMTKGGAKDITTTTAYDKKGNVAGQVMQARATSQQISDINKAVAGEAQLAGLQRVTKTGTGAAVGSLFQKVFNGQSLKTLNRNLFTMQMASLGVAFSFMALQKQIIGIFSGLEDLGNVISANALGFAYSSMVNPEGQGTDIFATMGISSDDATKAWLGFQAVTNIIQSLVNGLATKVFTPEMSNAIIQVVTALATQLAKPEVVKAVQDILYAVLDVVLALIPMIPSLAEFISLLSDRGLLGAIVALVLIAPYLLQILSLFGFAMQGLTIVVPIVSGAVSSLVAALGVGFGTALAIVIGIISLVLIVIDFLINIFKNFEQTGWSLLTPINALIDTLNDIGNVIAWIVNTASGIAGFGNITGGNFLTGVKDFVNQGQSGYNTVNHNYYNYGNLGKDDELKMRKYGERASQAVQ